MPRDEYFAESVESDESLLVIYRPRDNQYVLPFIPPKDKLLFNYDFFAEVYVDSVLIAQLRSKIYLSVRVPVGSHALLVSPYADYNPMLEYRSASLHLETQPGTTYFLDTRIEAGKGYIGSMVEEKSAETAIKELDGIVDGMRVAPFLGAYEQMYPESKLRSLLYCVASWGNERKAIVDDFFIAHPERPEHRAHVLIYVAFSEACNDMIKSCTDATCQGYSKI